MDAVKKERAVVGSPEALAFLFSGGHFINVAPRLNRAQRLARRKAIFQNWSHGVMAKLPWVSLSKPRREDEFAPQVKLKNVLAYLLALPAKDRNRIEAKRAVKAAGYRWKSVAKRFPKVTP